MYWFDNFMGIFQKLLSGLVSKNTMCFGHNQSDGYTQMLHFYVYNIMNPNVFGGFIIALFKTISIIFLEYFEITSKCKMSF